VKPWAGRERRLRKNDDRSLPLRIIEPTKGNVFFGGEDIVGLDRKRLQAIRRKMQIIFQDPFGSLDPHGPWDVSSAKGSGCTP